MIKITLGNGPPCKYSISSFTMSSEILEGGTVDGSVAEPVRAEVFLAGGGADFLGSAPAPFFGK